MAMSRDWRRLWFWTRVFVLANLLSILFADGTFVWFPVPLIFFHYGRLEMAEEIEDV